MAMNENRFDAQPDEEAKLDKPRFALHPLHEAALKIADLGINRPREKSRDLISLLLSHGARAWRYSQPEIAIHLHVSSHNGRFPVIMRMK